jgi:hypothetical protein
MHWVMAEVRGGTGGDARASITLFPEIRLSLMLSQQARTS